MGSGKSSVGRRLALLMGHRFVDTDDLVTHAENRAIADIFAQEGESYFREVEQRVLEEEIGIYGIVLSTGGGAILREENRTTLKKIGIVAWLDADPQVLFERATRSSKRPLLQTDNPYETFSRLLHSRREIYTSMADFRVDSTGMNHDEAA